MHIWRCMGSKFCVKFQRGPLKFHTKFWTHTPQNVHFTVMYFCVSVTISLNCDVISLSETGYHPLDLSRTYFNLSPLSVAYMRQWSGSALIQVSWTNADVLSNATLRTNLGASRIMYYKTFHSWQCIWQFRLRNNDGHFVRGARDESMTYSDAICMLCYMIHARGYAIAVAWSVFSNRTQVTTNMTCFRRISKEYKGDKYPPIPRQNLFTSVLLLYYWYANLAQIMAWHRTSDKPLSEPMMAQFTDAYTRLLWDLHICHDRFLKLKSKPNGAQNFDSVS